jgi:hypothetical protein
MTKGEILRLVAFCVGAALGVLYGILYSCDWEFPAPWSGILVGMTFLLLGASNVSDPPLYYIVNKMRDQVIPLDRKVTKALAVLSCIVGSLFLLVSCCGATLYR